MSKSRKEDWVNDYLNYFCFLSVKIELTDSRKKHLAGFIVLTFISVACLKILWFHNQNLEVS